MSGLVPEVVSRAAPVSEDSDEPSQKSGLRTAHVAGGGFAVVVGAVVVAVCNHFGWHVSDADSLVVGGAVVSVGAGLGHVVGSVGVSGAFKQLWKGSGS